MFNSVYPLILLISGANSIATYTPQPEPSCKAVPKTNVGKLKEAVFCGYNPSVRPVKHHSNQTVVKLSLFPTHLSWVVDSMNGVYMGFWLYVQWQDDLLVWNVSDYDGLGEIYTEPGKIWTPDIIVSDPPQQSSMTRQMNCAVNYKGLVECTVTSSALIHCNFDLKYFPYDRHSCRVVFQPQSYKGSELDLDFIDAKNGADSLKFFRSHGIWDVVNPKYNRGVTRISNDIHLLDLEFTFDLERRNTSYMTCTTPVLVMIMMTLSIFWLEVQSSARIILPALTVVSDILLIEWLGQTLRSALTQPPIIVVFFQYNLMMTGLALVWTIVTRTVCLSSYSPHWLHMVSTHLNKSNFVKFLLPQDIFLKTGASGDEDESSLVVHRDCVEQQWRILTTLGDRIMFGLYSLIFMYLYILLSP